MSIGGVTDTGFTLPTMAEIQTDLEVSVLANVDPGLDLSENTPLGQLVAIFSEKLAEVWELGQTAYNGFNSDAAESFLLDALCALTGTLRLAATPSVVRCTVNLNAGVTLPAGSIANVVGYPGSTFALQSPVTNSTGSAANVTGAVFVAQANGPTVANAGTLTQITAPVTGWNSITNPLDAVLGHLQETDTPLRQRRVQELAASGATTVDAIRADVLEVPGVIQCFVFENVAETTDANGLPPHSVEVIIFDGVTPNAADADVLAAVWKGKGSGVNTIGTTTGTTPDSFGTARTVSFSRATPRSVWFEFDVTTDVLKFPADGAAQIKAAVAAEGSIDLNLGVDVIALRYRAIPLNVPGVTDVTALRLGFSAHPVGTTNLTISDLEIASLDTSHMLVNGA